MSQPNFPQAKPKSQISCAVNAQLISAFVFATWIVKILFYLYPKFQDSYFLLWVYRTVYVGPGRKYRRAGFLRRNSNDNILLIDYVSLVIGLKFTSHYENMPI